MKKIYIVIILFLCFTLSGCYEKYSKSASINYTKLSPEEQGVMNLIGPAIGYIVHNVEVAEESLEIWNELDEKEGGINKFRASYNRNMFFNSCKKLAKILDYPVPKGQILLVPKSLDDVLLSLRKFLSLKGRINIDNPDLEDRNLLREYAFNVLKADKRLANMWRNRQINYENQNFSHDLTVEAVGLPFKINITKGLIKLTHSYSYGPIKFTASTGSSSDQGVKTLIIQNSKYKRYYAIGTRNLELRIPASILKVEGDVMTITAIE